MIYFAAVIACLTATWCLTLASFAWEDVALGIAISTLLVGIYRKAIFPRTAPEAGHVLHVVLYMPWFLWMVTIDVIKGTWQVATYVTGIRKLDHPGIVKIPLGNHTPSGVGIVGLIVTLSPGSFMVDIDWEDRSMLVHFIDASDPDRLRRDVEKYYRLWEYGSRLPGHSGPDRHLKEPG